MERSPLREATSPGNGLRAVPTPSRRPFLVYNGDLWNYEITYFI